MTAELESYLGALLPEMKNVSRLFGLPEDIWERAEDAFAWRTAETGGAYECVCTGAGRRVSGRAEIPSDPDPRLQALHRKRAARRLCKQTAYRLCREVTGIHPPWGSLTGIRPTHMIREAMAEGLSVPEAARQVRERYDLLPEKADLLAEIVTVQDRMPPPGDGWMDVYVGIPFCTTRCAYCSFSSGVIGRGKLVAPYLEALFGEMAEGAALLRDSGKKLRSVYVGGGTPTSLDESSFRRLLAELMERFPGALEYTVEAGRPDSITRDKLLAIRESGAGRISINPQTMVDRTLQVIGRSHTAAQVEEAYALARSVGMGHINMDVIAGLPGETLADFACTMEAARRLAPESLTGHTLAIKRSSRLHLEQHPLPDGETAAAMVQLGRETAAAMGMEAYYLYRQKHMAGNQENTGYALPGHACIYNVDMMEETSHVLAMGAGAISKRIYPEEGHIGRAPNVSNIELYIGRWREMAERKRKLFLEA